MAAIVYCVVQLAAAWLAMTSAAPNSYGGGGASKWTCAEDLQYDVFQNNNKCYQFVNVEKYWDEAQDFCYFNQGRLLTIVDDAEMSFIKRTLSTIPWTNNGIWIGANDLNVQGQWQWSSPGQGKGGHEPVTWSYWEPQHPGGLLTHLGLRDCVRMTRKSGWRWHETPCRLLNWKYYFICEYSGITVGAGKSEDSSAKEEAKFAIAPVAGGVAAAAFLLCLLAVLLMHVTIKRERHPDLVEYQPCQDVTMYFKRKRPQQNEVVYTPCRKYNNPLWKESDPAQKSPLWRDKVLVDVKSVKAWYEKSPKHYGVNLHQKNTEKKNVVPVVHSEGSLDIEAQGIEEEMSPLNNLR